MADIYDMSGKKISSKKTTVQEEVKSLFPLEKLPEDNCPFCQKSGTVGFFKNSKSIPCRCCFESSQTWFVVFHEIMCQPKTAKDEVINILKKSSK